MLWTVDFACMITILLSILLTHVGSCLKFNIDINQ